MSKIMAKGGGLYADKNHTTQKKQKKQWLCWLM